eukprot:3974644-Prymnesium_polylepis.1
MPRYSYGGLAWRGTRYTVLELHSGKCFKSVSPFLMSSEHQETSFLGESDGLGVQGTALRSVT